jgi:hypothetical protein
VFRTDAPEIVLAHTITGRAELEGVGPIRSDSPGQALIRFHRRLTLRSNAAPDPSHGRHGVE